MLNFRKIVLIALAVFALVIAVALMNLVIQTVNIHFTQFVRKNFPIGTWTRLQIMAPLVNIALFALFRSIAIRAGFVSRDTAARLESRCHRAFGVVLPVSLGLAIGVAFVGWLPHYLYWPWWMDLEHFAMSAQMWDSGIRPYRDLVDFNFPGPTYFMWILGKAFGWGRPMVANAVDALFVVTICALVVAWSRSRLGSVAPGLVSAFLIVRYYFSLDYARVMQRDWYVAGLAIAAICLVQLRWPRHRGIVAGTLLSLACCLRPYAILAVVPVLVALWAETAGDRRNRLAELARCLTAMAAGTIVLWLPLALHGILDDFVRTFVDEARRGAYKSSVSEPLAAMLRRQVDTKVVFTGCIGLTAALIAFRNDSARLRLVAAWAVACAAMLFYMPMCPVRHAYTEIALEIFACVACGIGLWVLMESHTIVPSVKVVTVAIWFAFHFPGWPQFCEFRASGLAVADLVHWRNPAIPPPGCRTELSAFPGRTKTPFRWTDYQETLRYVRERTDPETRVANFLWLHPFPAINGPTGRKIVFPCAEGILWLRSVNPGLEPRFAQALESAERSIVIRLTDTKDPRPPCPYPIIDATIRDRFEPVESFGNFEIWFRKPFEAGTNDESAPLRTTNEPPE